MIYDPHFEEKKLVCAEEKFLCSFILFFFFQKYNRVFLKGLVKLSAFECCVFGVFILHWFFTQAL